MTYQSLNDVINTCQQTINMLYKVASQTPDPRVQNKLSESAHHLRHCVEDCRFATQKLYSQDFGLTGWGQQVWGQIPHQLQQQQQHVPTTVSPLQTQVQTPMFV